MGRARVFFDVTLALAVLAGCHGGGARAEAPVAATQPELDVPASAPMDVSAPALVVTPPPPEITGCTLQSSKWATVRLRASPHGELLLEAPTTRRSVTLGTDGTVVISATAMLGSLRLRAFASRNELEIFVPKSLRIAGIVRTRAPLRWEGSGEGDVLTLGFTLPDGVTFDDASRLETHLACSEASLDEPDPFSMPDATRVWVDAVDLATAPGGRARLRGVSGAAYKLGSRPGFIAVAIEKGDSLFYGWVPRRRVTEGSFGLGHGWGTGSFARSGYPAVANAIACPTPVTVYLPSRDGLATIGKVAAGASFVVQGSFDATWASVALGAEDDPQHAIGWRMKNEDLASCNARSVRPPAKWTF
ncbi:hypothetical protein BH09MYX1_BH09MYX1_17030 [soil metagenome]